MTVTIDGENRLQSWDELKQQGSAHYKDGATEPIDLYRSGDMFRHFALCSIIKYAFRNRNINNPVKNKDMDKIIHYAELLKASCGEGENTSNDGQKTSAK